VEYSLNEEKRKLQLVSRT